jgi:hypothetical protein
MIRRGAEIDHHGHGTEQRALLGASRCELRSYVGKTKEGRDCSPEKKVLAGETWTTAMGTVDDGASMLRWGKSVCAGSAALWLHATKMSKVWRGNGDHTEGMVVMRAIKNYRSYVRGEREQGTKRSSRARERMVFGGDKWVPQRSCWDKPRKEMIRRFSIFYFI